MQLLTEFVLPIVLALIGTLSGCFVANKAIKEGMRCILRNNITDIYYLHSDDKTLRERERKNLDKMYEAYKALRGNSFADDIYAEIRNWEVIQ